MVYKVVTFIVHKRIMGQERELESRKLEMVVG